MKADVGHDMCSPTPNFCLETLSTSVEYYKWIYGLMHPYLGTEVLELGVGIGNLTVHLLGEGRFVTAIDTDERMLVTHRSRIPQTSRLRTACVSLHELATRSGYCGRFNSVVSSNVLEHITEDLEADVVQASFNLLR